MIYRSAGLIKLSAAPGLEQCRIRWLRMGCQPGSAGTAEMLARSRSFAEEVLRSRYGGAVFRRKSNAGRLSNGKTTEFHRTHQDAELICREGEVSGEMYVIRSGRVRIFKQAGDRELELAVLEKGNFFGEMSVLEGLPRDATAQAVGETELLVMTSGALLVRLRRDPTFAFELLQRLSARVRGLNARLMEAVAGTQEERVVRDSLLYHPDSESQSEAGR